VHGERGQRDLAGEFSEQITAAKKKEVATGEEDLKRKAASGTYATGSIEDKLAPIKLSSKSAKTLKQFSVLSFQPAAFGSNGL
jgi:hypothetical protein